MFITGFQGGLVMPGGATIGRYVTPKDLKDQLKKKHELTTKEAAMYCDMSPQTLYNLINQGLGPQRDQKGDRGAMLFTVPELDAWKRQRTQKKRAFTK
jgi:predicted DNA-binding transcriptional regulator AlpA